jgi:hypothetical protein
MHVKPAARNVLCVTDHGNLDNYARACIQSCPEKPSKHLWLFSVASCGCFVSFGVT